MRTCQRHSKMSRGLLVWTVSAGLTMLFLGDPTVAAAAETQQLRIRGTTLSASSSTFLDDCTRRDTYLMAFTTTDGPSVSFSSTTSEFCAGSTSFTYGAGPASLLKVTAS